MYFGMINSLLHHPRMFGRYADLFPEKNNIFLNNARGEYIMNKKKKKYALYLIVILGRWYIFLI